MFKAFGQFVKRRRYLREQSQIGRCSVYFVDNCAVIFPQSLPNILVPRRRVKAIFVTVDDSAGIGRIVSELLEESKQITAAGKKWKASDAIAAFFEDIEAFRHLIKMGKRSFESQLSLISITQMQGSITLCPRRKAHGRYAYEAIQDSLSTQIVLAKSASDLGIGKAVVSLVDQHNQLTK